MSLVKTSTDFLMDSWKPGNIDCITNLSRQGMFAEDVIVSTPFFCNTGVHCIAQWVAYWFHFFPNIEFSVHNTFAYEHTVVCQWKAEAFQERSFLGITPSKNKVESFGDTVLVFNEKNQIVRYTVKVDLKLLLSNLSTNSSSISAASTAAAESSLDLHQNLKVLFASLISRYHALSFRELECTAFFISGFSSKQIGEMLGISARTVEAHLQKARVHLDCMSRSQMIERFLADATYFMFQDLARLLLIKKRILLKSSKRD